MTELPWFLGNENGNGQQKDWNYVEISALSGDVLEDAEEGVLRCDLDVPKDAFERMLDRVCRHRGYSARSRDVHEVLSRDALLQTWTEAAAQQQQHQQHQQQQQPQQQHRQHQQPQQQTPQTHTRTTIKRLVEARTMGSPPLLVRTYVREVLPFSSFPCDSPVQARRRVRQLDVRVHQNTRLVFELVSDSDGPPGRVVRRVRMEIDLGKRGDSTLQRTIENTVQVVLLGMTPQGKGLQLGRK